MNPKRIAELLYEIARVDAERSRLTTELAAEFARAPAVSGGAAVGGTPPKRRQRIVRPRPNDPNSVVSDLARAEARRILRDR